MPPPLHPTIILPFASDMEGEVGTIAQVERFEDYCLKKRGLEVDIEVALGRRDEKAMEAIDIAERKLENTKREGVTIMARVEVALQGNFERADKSGSPSETRRNNLLIALQGRVFPHGTNTSGDTDTSTSIDLQNRLKSANCVEEDDLSDDFITLLVLRYTDICHERRILHEEIEDTLERKERMAAERLRCANIMLQTTREKAVEILAALNEASGGDTKIRLPVGDIDSVGSKPTSVGVAAALESGPSAIANSPHQDVRHRPLYPRGPDGRDSPHSSISSRQPSHHGSTHGPPGTKPRVHDSQPVAPPPPSQQPMPPPPNMSGMSWGMSNGAAVGAPRVLGQPPRSVPGQVPHQIGAQGIPPPMVQWPGPYPYVGNMPDK